MIRDRLNEMILPSDTEFACFDLDDEACTGCGRCAVDAPEGLIAIRDSLAVIDYSRNALASRLAIERCPTGAIVWLEEGQFISDPETEIDSSQRLRFDTLNVVPKV